eukprot:gene37371-48873_t
MGCASSGPKEFDDSFFYSSVPEGERFDESIFLPGEMHVMSWNPQNEPKAIVIISHGVHEHALRYYAIAHALTSSGFGVYGLDHYAHGKSRGTRGLIDDYHIVVDEFIKFAEWVKARHPDTPIFLLSHSLGTVIAILALNKLPFIQAVVYSANPLFTGPSASSPFGLKCLYPLSQTSFATTFTSIMASIDPKGAAAPIFIDAITSNEKEIQNLMKDPYRYAGDLMNKTAFEILKMIVEAKLELPKLKTATLCIHGTEDTIALPKGSEYLMEHISSTNKTLQLFP